MSGAGRRVPDAGRRGPGFGWRAPGAGIRDSGAGIGPADLERIWDPDFTTGETLPTSTDLGVEGADEADALGETLPSGEVQPTSTSVRRPSAATLAIAASAVAILAVIGVVAGMVSSKVYDMVSPGIKAFLDRKKTDADA